MRLVVDTIEFGSRELPRWNTVSISGYHIREAGSTAVQELAFTIADGMAYVEACIARGLRVDDFAPRLSFFFNSHSRLLRGDRQVPGVAPDLVEADERALPGGERALDLDALPHPDRGRVADARSSRSTTSPGSRRRRWPRSSAGRSRSTPTRTTRRSPCRRPRPRCSPSASSRSWPRRRGVASTVDPLGGSWFVEALTEPRRARRLALPRRDRPAGRHGRRDRRGLPAARDRGRGIPVPARVRRRASG